MNPQPGANEAVGRIQIVRPGSLEDTMPQGVLGADAISRQTTGSEGLFMSPLGVPVEIEAEVEIDANSVGSR